MSFYNHFFILLKAPTDLVILGQGKFQAELIEGIGEHPTCHDLSSMMWYAHKHVAIMQQSIPNFLK